MGDVYPVAIVVIGQDSHSNTARSTTSDAWGKALEMELPITSISRGANGFSSFMIAPTGLSREGDIENKREEFTAWLTEDRRLHDFTWIKVRKSDGTWSHDDSDEKTIVERDDAAGFPTYDHEKNPW